MDKKNNAWINERLIVTGIAAMVATSGASMILQDAWGHGVTVQLQSRFVRITDETFSTQLLHTGEELEVKGKLQSLVNRDLRAWVSLFAESTNAGNGWEFVAREPPGNVFDIPPNTEIPYRLVVKALEPGVYHAHTQVNIASIGPGLGPGQTVIVQGTPVIKPLSIGNSIYQSILIAAGLGISFATKPWQVI